MMVERIAGIGAFVAVAAVVALGFATTGPPQHVRLMELDRHRLNDLGAIVSRLSNASEGGAPGKLPASLRVREEGYDPLTGEPYGYQRESATRYRLCATFALPSDSNASEASWRRGARDAAWEHRAGRTCFRFDVTRSNEPIAVDARSR